MDSHTVRKYGNYNKLAKYQYPRPSLLLRNGLLYSDADAASSRNWRCIEQRKNRRCDDQRPDPYRIDWRRSCSWQLIPGAGIGISGGPGTLTISAIGGGISWQTTSVNIANMSVNNGYICISPGGALTLGLPTTAGVGSILRVALNGATSWQITQAAGQQIRIGSNTTTLGAGGSLTSTAQGDAVELVCVTANTIFQVVSSMGNITFV